MPQLSSPPHSSSPLSAAPAADGGWAPERQIVALHLGGDIYGVDITEVHSVIMPQLITPVPQTAPYVAGILNLRGRILPVVDLRRRFGLPAQPETRSTRIVIVETQAGAECLTAGLIVDAVSEVIRLPQSAIEPPSALSAVGEAGCVRGIGRVPQENGTQLLLLLNVARVLGGLEMPA